MTSLHEKHYNGNMGIVETSTTCKKSFQFGLIFYFRFVAKSIFHSDEEVPVQKVKVEVMPASKIQRGDLILEVKTSDSCWMRVKTDNKSIFEKTLSKGSRERWQAKEKIELRIGKPEALEVFLNGEPIDLKKEGVKRNLIITHEAIVGN